MEKSIYSTEQHWLKSFQYIEYREKWLWHLQGGMQLVIMRIHHSWYCLACKNTFNFPHGRSFHKCWKLHPVKRSTPVQANLGTYNPDTCTGTWHSYLTCKICNPCSTPQGSYKNPCAISRLLRRSWNHSIVCQRCQETWLQMSPWWGQVS
jgi:hypothetical protein